MSDTPTSASKATRKSGSETRKRHLVLRCRVLPSEADDIRRIATRMNISVGELLRCGALDTAVEAPKKSLSREDQLQLARVLSKLGLMVSDLREMTQLARQGGSVIVPESMPKAIEKLTGLTNRLVRTLRAP